MQKFLASLLTTCTLASFLVMPVSAQEVAVPPELANLKSEGFTITPARPNSVNPRKFIFEIRPGESKQETVVIKNLSSESGTFYLYGADPTFSAQGTPAYKTRQAGGDGEGQWITFNQPEINLTGGEEKAVQFTLAVPEDAELGDYRIGIAMEKTKKDANNPNITIATRIILHTDVKVTDNPSPVPKQGEMMDGPQKTTPDDSPWQIYYFWISLGLFIASFLALIWVTFQEKKQPFNSVGTKAVKRSAKKKAAARKAKSSSKKTSKKKKSSGKKSGGRKKKSGA